MKHFGNADALTQVVGNPRSSNHKKDHTFDFNWSTDHAEDKVAELSSDSEDPDKDDLASDCGLCRPYPPSDEISDPKAPKSEKDTVHSELKGTNKFGNCYNTKSR